MGKDIKSSLRYVLLFFFLILYWEILLYIVAHGDLSDIRGWFVLFALAQALIPAALCGWGRDRLDRVVTALLALVIFAFYCAHLIYCRVFGSMITMSMVGMGGDALYGFGGAMMSTVQESLGWLFAFAAPVIALIVWIFLKGPAAVKIRHALRPALLVLGVLVWLAVSLSLRLGGESSTSAYYAYTSSYVDTDTAAGRLGVLTTSLLELKSMFFQGDEAETATVLDVREPEPDVIPVMTPEENPAQAEQGGLGGRR